MHLTLLHWADDTIRGRRGVRRLRSRGVRTPERYGDSGKRLARFWRMMLTGNPEPGRVCLLFKSWGSRVSRDYKQPRPTAA